MKKTIEEKLLEEIAATIDKAIIADMVSGQFGSTPYAKEILSIISRYCVFSKDGNCPFCGEPMFWYEQWNRFICNSWNYMEGGCKTWSD